MDYEKGVAAWDIGIILTRHSTENAGDPTTCNRVRSLLSTKGQPARVRLDAALMTRCSCGKGDSSAEQTTLAKEKRQHDLETAAAAAPAVE